MEAQQPQAEYADPSSPQVVATEVDMGQTGTLALPPANQASEQWQRIGEQVSAFLAKLPDYIGQFFSDYSKPITTIGLILAALITVKVVLAVIAALNDIPLLSPTFQLIGIGYTIWFVYRYLLKAENRQELSGQIETLKQQVMGGQ